MTRGDQHQSRLSARAPVISPRNYGFCSRGSSFGLAAQCGNLIFAFCFSLIVGRLFHAQGTGTFFEALAIFVIASNVSDLGADDGLAWAVPRLRSAQRTADVRRLLAYRVPAGPRVVGRTCLALFLARRPDRPPLHARRKGDPSPIVHQDSGTIRPDRCLGTGGASGHERVRPGVAACWNLALPHSVASAGASGLRRCGREPASSRWPTPGRFRPCSVALPSSGCFGSSPSTSTRPPLRGHQPRHVQLSPRSSGSSARRVRSPLSAR